MIKLLSKTRIVRIVSFQTSLRRSLDPRHQDVGCRISDVGCQMSDVESRMSDVRCRMSNLGCQISDVGCRMLDIKSRMSVVGARMSDGTYITFRKLTSSHGWTILKKIKTD